MDSKHEAKDNELVRVKPTTASAEIANVSQQHAALLKKAVFATVPNMVNVRRGAAAQTPSKTSSQKGESDLLEDMVDQLPPVPDTPISWNPRV